MIANANVVKIEESNVCLQLFSRLVLRQEMMSLDTLIEAARYLELQEQKEQQQRQAVAPLVRTHPQPTSVCPQPTAILKPKQGQFCFHNCNKNFLNRKNANDLFKW